MKVIHALITFSAMFYSPTTRAMDADFGAPIDARWIDVKVGEQMEFPTHPTPVLSRETWGWIMVGVGAIGVVNGLGILTGLAEPVANTKTVRGDPVRVGAYCKDGTASSATGSGACSGHGGVSSWKTSRPEKEVVTGYGDPTVDGIGIMTLGLAMAGGGYFLIRPRKAENGTFVAELNASF